jgi:hypothetical protein
MQSSHSEHVKVRVVIAQSLYQLIYGLDDRGGRSGVQLGSRMFSTSSTPALGSTQPPIQWLTGALSPGGKAAVA